jgi:hypothetical protein
LYDDADEMLSTVAEYGGHVAAKASQNKEAAKTAALTTEQAAQQVLASARELMTRALIGKERAAVGSIQQQLTALEADFAVIHGLIENGDYLAAKVRAQALKNEGVAISEEIQGTIKKRNEKKPAAHA